MSTRDGVDARNVNGEVAMDVDARRVDLVEATLATCRAAEKAMFEATSARECAILADLASRSCVVLSQRRVW